MAVIYGRPETEEDLLNQSPISIKKVEDVETVHNELKGQLANEKKDFLRNLPSRIKEEERELERIKHDKKTTEQEFDEKIKNLEMKKAQGGISSITTSLRISIVKHVSKRREINRIKDLERKQLSRLSEWKENPDRIFNMTQSEKINQIKQLDGIKRKPIYAGAKGEVLVLKKLSELNDDYHILCGLNIELPRYITYNGKRNLGSAQMDFVVVSRKGVILIEVKNWSAEYLESHSGLNPYEQTDRAGRALWKHLKSWGLSPRITKVLLSIQGNMKYDPSYKHVLVSSLDRINYFIQSGQDELSDKDVMEVVNSLAGRVTK